MDKAFRILLGKVKQIETIFNNNDIYYFTKDGTLSEIRSSIDIDDTGGKTKLVVNGRDLIAEIRKIGKGKFTSVYGEDIINRIQTRLKNRRDICKKSIII